MSLRGSQGSRAIFTEGLASSYDAFRHRAKDDTETGAIESDLPEEFRWYLDQIAAFIPRDDRKVLDAHPKIAATTERVLDLWGRGEKVLVFCYFRATGRASFVCRYPFGYPLAVQIPTIPGALFRLRCDEASGYDRWAREPRARWRSVRGSGSVGTNVGVQT